jgi:hypothetical protein
VPTASPLLEAHRIEAATQSTKAPTAGASGCCHSLLNLSKSFSSVSRASAKEENVRNPRALVPLVMGPKSIADSKGSAAHIRRAPRRHCNRIATAAAITRKAPSTR